MKEWAWPTLGERYDHRHISHLYGAWPGDEIDPDRTPQLAKAALIADRHRVPERLAAHGRCHRALVGARLKDSYLVDTELRQLIEEGNVGPTLRCSHDPYAYPMPDAQGGIPTIMMEMLAYSRPGVIEVLPALPPSLVKGSINGMLLRTFARLNKLSWDMNARTVDLTITSVTKAGCHVDCAAWHRIGLRLSRSSGGQAAVRRGRLRSALAGRKTGGCSLEAWATQPAGLGELGRLMVAEQPIDEEFMKRRDFLKTSAATAGLVGTLTIEPMLGTAQK